MAVMPEKPQMKGQKDFPKVQMVATNFKSFISTARSSKLTLPFTEEKPSQGKVWPEKLNKGCTVLCWSRRRRTAGPAPASDALHSHERRSWRVKPLLIYPHDTWWSPWRSHRQWRTWSKPLEWLLPDPRQYHEAEWSPVWQAITCELILTNLLKLCHWGILHAISLKSSSAISPVSFRRGSVCVSHSWCSFFGTHHWPPGTHQIIMESGRFSGMFPINRHIFIYLYCKWHLSGNPVGTSPTGSAGAGSMKMEHWTGEPTPGTSPEPASLICSEQSRTDVHWHPGNQWVLGNDRARKDTS